MNDTYTQSAPQAQEIILMIAGRFVVEKITPKPASGEVGTLMEQLNVINEGSVNVVLPPHLKIFDPDA